MAQYAGSPINTAGGDQGTDSTVPINTNVDWATLVLDDLGAPVDDANLTAILDWMVHEDSVGEGPGNAGAWTGTAGANNPLNNGLGSGGGDGTGSYPDLTTAAEYAAKGLEGGIQGAAPAGQDLINDKGTQAFIDDIKKSGWASGHYPSWTAPFAVPTTTIAQSIADGATQPVVAGSGEVNSVPNPGGSGTSPDTGTGDGGGSGGSSSTTTVGTGQLGGAGNVLQMLDNLLNPSGGSALEQLVTLDTSNVVANVEKMVFRSIFSIAFAAIGYAGFKLLIGQGSGPGLISQLQGAQREAGLNARHQATIQLGQQRLQQRQTIETIRVEEAGKKREHQTSERQAKDTEIATRNESTNKVRRKAEATRAHRARTYRMSEERKAGPKRKPKPSPGGSTVKPNASTGAASTAVEAAELL